MFNVARLPRAVIGLLLTSACVEKGPRAPSPGSAARVAPAPRTVIAVAPVRGHFRQLESDSSERWHVDAMALTRNRLFVREAGGRVYAYALDSALTLLTRVSARFEEEHSQPAFLLPATDSTVVLLRREGRTAELIDEAGRTQSTWHWNSEGDAATFCAASDTTGLVLQRNGTNYRVRSLWRRGHLSRESALTEPWPGYYQRHALAGQLSAAPLPHGGCALAHLFELGIAVVRAAGEITTIPFIETLPPAKVKIDSTLLDGVSSKTSSVEGSIRGARAIAVSGDSALILFEGRERGAAARVDVYDLAQGRYRHTLNFNQRIEAIAASSHAVAILVRRDGRLGVWVCQLGDAATAPSQLNPSTTP